MKTLIKSLLAAFSLTLITVSATLAQTNPAPAATYQYSLYSTVDGKINIALDKQTNERVVVRLTNNKGAVLFTDYVGKHQKAARLRLDVSGLPDGAYQVEFSNEAGTATHALTLATRQPTETSRLIAVK